MSDVLRFDCFEVDLAAGHLRKRGVRIGLREQPFQVLVLLLERPGQVITRDELRRRLWRDEVFVDFDNSLNIAIACLRTALGDSAEHPRFIETLPKRGYRFIGNVSALPSAAEPGPARRPRLVVLPFVNSSGDPAQEYFSDAMTDEVITALASLAPEQFAVIARTTAMRYKGSHKDVARIGRELGVDYVVEGTLRHTEDQVAVNVQLIQTSDQAHLFARRYQAEPRDIFHMQNSIAQDIAAHIDASRIAGEIHTRLSRARARRKPTENLAAYNEYIQGRYLLERLTPEAMARAKQHFEDVIGRDPDFALAHYALAGLYSWLGYTGYMRPKDAYLTGITYAMRAVGIDDTLAEAHAVLAEYHKQLDYNWPAAEREMARALELDPESPFVRLRQALVVLMPRNRIAEAAAEIERALELDPLAGLTRAWLGVMMLLSEEYDRAIDEARILLELEPASCWPHFISGIAYRQKYYEGFVLGRRRPAEASAETDFAEKAVAGHLKAVDLAPGSDYFLGWLGLALGVCGRKDEARTVLEQVKRSERYILPTSFAHVHLGLGEFDAAFEWFARAVEERDQNMMPILSYRHFDPLREDPRFAALLRKIKLG
jgi:TolB-like protein